MKMTTFWDMESYSLVEVDRRFRGTYSRHQGTSEQYSLLTTLYKFINKITIWIISFDKHLRHNKLLFTISQESTTNYFKTI
jgi:hypothetical protein